MDRKWPIAFAGVALLVFSWGRAYPQKLVRLGVWLREALPWLEAPRPRSEILGVLGQMGADRAHFAECVAGNLPREFDPDRHFHRQAGVEACLREVGGRERARMFSSLVFGHDVRSGRPLRVRDEQTDGCLGTHTGRVVIEYVDVDEATCSCSCFGLPMFADAFGADYRGCLAVPMSEWFSYHRARQTRPWSLLAHRSLGIGVLSWFQQTSSEVHATEVLPSRPWPSRMSPGALHFRVHSVSVPIGRTGPSATRQVEYRRLPQSVASDDLFTPMLRDSSDQCPEGAEVGGGAWRLEAHVGESSYALWLSGACSQHVLQLDARLRALPEIECRPQARALRGGAACQISTAGAPYIALRRGGIEIRAISSPLEQALCTAVAGIMTQKSIALP